MPPPPLSGNSVWQYERALRFYEYHRNTGHKLMRLFYAWLLQRRGERLGFSISGNVFGPGLRINHHGLLIVNAKAKVGKWCDIHQGVNIGENGYYDADGKAVNEVPSIGDYCFIAPGAKLYGGIMVGDNVRVAANAVVRKDVDDNKTVFGDPQEERDSKRKIMTIASPEFEQLFLQQYPQYKGMI